MNETKENRKMKDRPDTVIMSKVKSKDLATALMFFDKNDVYIRTRSDLMRVILEQFVALLVRNGHEYVDSTEIAIEVLKAHRMYNPNQTKQMQRNIMKNIQQENIEYGEIEESGHTEELERRDEKQERMRTKVTSLRKRNRIFEQEAHDIDALIRAEIENEKRMSKL